jgi:hypothetical protein
MKHHEEQGLISSIKVSRRAPNISHLLFADDSLLFFKLDEDQAKHVSDLLLTFEKGSGQKLSPAKCSLLVQRGADDVVVSQVCQILGGGEIRFWWQVLGSTNAWRAFVKGSFPIYWGTVCEAYGGLERVYFIPSS